ncbi:chloride channel protein [Acidithiobacillus sp. HP-6]|uniref:chloride channel protein n=1 Tax=unclassified Acidithiobacillus TaxID=2614800 RepID=UPI00187A4C38|nr:MULTISPECIES: chloride channel protein [unclassified Acidithiobacillus]MBE7562761.1 chloride channel protein [Acidithiobacillus sp. HP-6]MBE7568899.1 chloride channel protein [Acidithiobacillus sp. HP-2]
MNKLVRMLRQLFYPHVHTLDSTGLSFSPKFWLLIVFTGIGAGLGADFLMFLLSTVQHLSYHYAHGYFQVAAEHVSGLHRLGVLISAGVLATFAVWLLRRLSHGANSDVVHAIWFQSGSVNFWHTIAQAILSMTIVGMGASLGREGAPKQVGMAIASLLSRWGRLSSTETRFLAACGAGAGMGAVYNVPLGGALFALEVLLGSVTLPLLLPAITTALIATAVSWITLPDQPTYTLPIYTFHFGELCWSLLFGPLAGVMSVLFVRLIIWADLHKPQSGWFMWAPLLMFTLLGILAIPYPQLLGNGKDVTEFAFNSQLPLLLMLTLVVLKPLVTAGCLGSGAPGGLFTPSITYGAVLGGSMGDLWSLIWPGAAIGSYAVIGAGALLAATMQAPLAAIVLLLELTHNTMGIMIPVLLAIVSAVFTARLLDKRSIYSGPAGIEPFIEQVSTHPVHTAFDDLITPSFQNIVPISASYSHLVKLMGTDDPPHNFYVVDHSGQLAGMIFSKNLRTADLLTRTLNVAAADDLKIPITAIRSDQSRKEVIDLLDQPYFSEMPVIDCVNKRYIGVVRSSSIICK